MSLVLQCNDNGEILKLLMRLLLTFLHIIVRVVRRNNNILCKSVPQILFFNTAFRVFVNIYIVQNIFFHHKPLTALQYGPTEDAQVIAGPFIFKGLRLFGKVYDLFLCKIIAKMGNALVLVLFLQDAPLGLPWTYLNSYQDLRLNTI